MMHYSAPGLTSAGTYYNAPLLAPTSEKRSFTKAACVGTIAAVSLLAFGLTTPSNNYQELLLSTRVKVPTPTEAALTAPTSLRTPTARATAPSATTVPSRLGASTTEYGFPEAAPPGPIPQDFKDIESKLTASPTSRYWIWFARVACTVSAFALVMRKGSNGIAMAATTGEEEGSKKGSKREMLKGILKGSAEGPTATKPYSLPADKEEPEVVIAPKGNTVWLSREEKAQQKILLAMEKAAKQEAADAKKRAERIKKWRTVALIGLGIYASSWVLNTLIFSFLQYQGGSITLGEFEMQEVATGLAEAERQLRYDSIMGHGPMLSKAEMTENLREIGKELEAEQVTNMLQTAANTICDLAIGILLALGIVINKKKVSDFVGGFTNGFMSLSNTTQAFGLLLVSDVVVGYHSADGWFTVLRLLGAHYGVHTESYENFVSLFIATVPVGLDVAFKFWVFRELRKLSPSTQVILSEIDRH